LIQFTAHSDDGLDRWSCPICSYRQWRFSALCDWHCSASEDKGTLALDQCQLYNRWV